MSEIAITPDQLRMLIRNGIDPYTALASLVAELITATDDEDIQTICRRALNRARQQTAAQHVTRKEK